MSSCVKRRSLVSIRIVTSFLLAYATILSIACYVKFETFQYTDFDLAVHTQSLHNMLRGSIDCSILGIPFPGNHMAPILALIAPIFALFPSPATLLLLQALVLSAGAVAVFLYAERHLPRPYPSILAAAYLLYPPLALMNLYEFHPIALASTFLLYALLTYDCERPKLYSLFLLLAMACQENVGLIVILLGVKAAIDRRRPAWCIGPIVAGALWFVACIMWVMPRFNPGIIQFDAIYGHFGRSLPEIGTHLIRHPIAAMEYALTPPKLLYLMSLLLPLALTPLAAPLALLPAMPVVAQRLLSARGSESTILFHYQAELIPFIFAAAIHGLKKLGEIEKVDMQKIAVTCLAALTILSVDMTNVPSALAQIALTARSQSRLTGLRRQILSRVDDESGVVATFRYLPHLAGRSNLHSLHHVYTGYYTLSSVPYPVPADVDIAIIDQDDPLTFGAGGFFTQGGQANIQDLLRVNRMAPVIKAGSLLVFARIQQPLEAQQDSGRQPASL